MTVLSLDLELVEELQLRWPAGRASLRAVKSSPKIANIEIQKSREIYVEELKA